MAHQPEYYIYIFLMAKKMLKYTGSLKDILYASVSVLKKSFVDNQVL